MEVPRAWSVGLHEKEKIVQSRFISKHFKWDSGLNTNNFILRVVFQGWLVGIKFAVFDINKLDLNL